MHASHLFQAALLGSIACVATACFGNETTEFPPGLEPVAENTAPLPMGTDANPYPEVMETVHGTADGLMFAHSRAYVHANPGKVWAALQDPEVVIDRRNTDRHQVTVGVEPDYEYSFLVHYEVDDLITVEWDENWRYGTIVGSSDDPEEAVLAFQKTFGTTFIKSLRGSMSIEVVDPGIVLFGMVEELDAVMTDSSTLAGYHADVFANIQAAVNDQPLPEF